MKKLVLVLCFLAISGDALFGQSIILGSGTAVNATNVSSPVNISSRRVVSQMVYTKAELNSAGITGPGTIRKMGFYVTQAPDYAIPGYQVSMKHTTAANASGNLEGGYTIVKTASTYTPVAGGWDILTLNTPFVWNGTDNIVVRVCWSQVSPAATNSGQCRVYNVTSGYKHRSDNLAGGACANVPSTTLNTKPQINFIFDTVTVWTGALNANWNLAANWTKGLPNMYMDCRIPAGTPNIPNVNTTRVCDELILQGSLTLASAGIMEVHGHFNNTGTLIDNGGIIKMMGTGSSNISGTMSIGNLRIESTGGTTVTSGTLSVTKELQVNQSIFNTNDAVILKSTASGTARINELKPECTYTLNMFDLLGNGWSGGFLTVSENGVPFGVYSQDVHGSSEQFKVTSGSTLLLNYTAGSFDVDNGLSLVNQSGTTVFSDPVTLASGNIFTTTASCPFTPMVVGDISMERYIDAGETFWRYFTSAVQGATVGEYLDDFVTAGFPGSPWPAFPFNSVSSYVETMGPGLGYVECTGTSQVINAGQGLQVWCGDTITGTMPFTLDLVGQPNQGPITFPVTYTNTGTLLEDGWNLVGNPYASTIDWASTSWTKVNMADAIYIQNPDNQQYAAYVAGASVNGGSRYIASQQSFWVYASAASPQLIATEAVKSTVDQAFIKEASAISAGVTIRLKGIEHFDEVVIRDVENAQMAYDPAYDAKEMWGGWGLMPQLSFVYTYDEDLMVHSFDFDNQEWIVPLRACVFETGTYQLEFENIDELNVPCFSLEDTYTGLSYEITEGLALPFELSDTAWDARFLLHIGKTYQTASQSSTCFDGSDGMIEIDLDDPAMVSYDITVNGVTTTASATADPMQINGLSSGIYNVEIPSLVNSCGLTSFNFVINEPSPITPSVDAQDELFGSDGALSVTVVGGTQPYTYLWNSGEISNHLSGLAEGTYDLIITDANGCTWSGSFTVGSSLSAGGDLQNEIKYIYYPDFNKVQIFGWTPKSNQELFLVNNAGQVIAKYNCVTENAVQELELPKSMAAGVYMITSGTGEIQFRFSKN